MSMLPGRFTAAGDPPTQSRGRSSGMFSPSSYPKVAAMPWLAVARGRTPSVAATTCAETTSHTLVRTRISGAVCRSSRVRARVARSVTGSDRTAVSAVAQRPESRLAGLAGEPVEEDLPVEVVDLVLQAPRH